MNKHFFVCIGEGCYGSEAILAETRAEAARKLAELGWMIGLSRLDIAICPKCLGEQMAKRIVWTTPDSDGSDWIAALPGLPRVIGAGPHKKDAVKSLANAAREYIDAAYESELTEEPRSTNMESEQ
jgi:predicted RNase H-like HicB family nuclease